MQHQTEVDHAHPRLEDRTDPLYHSVWRPHLQQLKSDRFAQKFGLDQIDRFLETHLMLIQLTYASRASNLLGPMDVKDILRSSQRNNAAVGVTGALCLSNGIFLQQLEGDRLVVNELYHRILKDPRHRDPAVLDFSEIISRRFVTWSMGLISSTEENRNMFLKYASRDSFDPYAMSPATLRAFFAEVFDNVRWLS